jgi:3-methyladenine DNA glycosylase/8-oxoguanine DNA glycosylase
MRKYPDFKAGGQFEIVMPEPYDFSRTVAKPAGWHWSTPGEIFENGTLWSGTYVDGTPVGLKMSAAEEKVSVTFYVRSPLTDDEKDALQAAVELGLGAEEDLSAFYAFAHDDDVLSVTVKDLYGMRAGRLDDLFGRVILAITLQMAPLKRSESMMAKLLDGYGVVIAFDGKVVVLWPTPADIARLEPAELRRRANLGYRAERLVNAARYLVAHPMSLRALRSLPEPDALKSVMQIPGIGRYSAGLILGRSSAPIDVWSVVIMSELLLGRTPENPRREISEVIQAMSERWGEWSWMAFVYILNDLSKLATIYRLSRVT